jgi:hypothetical protein
MWIRVESHGVMSEEWRRDGGRFEAIVVSPEACQRRSTLRCGNTMGYRPDGEISFGSRFARETAHSLPFDRMWTLCFCAGEVNDSMS